MFLCEHAHMHAPLQSHSKHVSVSVLWYWWVIIFGWMGDTCEGFTAGVHVTHVSCTYTHTDFQRPGRHLHPFSHTRPNNDKWIYFIFQRRRLFGSLLYEAEMYIVSEASVGKATGGAFQSEAQSSCLDWYLAPGLDPPSGDRSNKFITKQQSVY